MNRSVDDIDLFSGLISEERGEPGQLVGPTLACLLGNQFHALKFGDRFFFETDRMPEGFNDGKLGFCLEKNQSKRTGEQFLW